MEISRLTNSSIKIKSKEVTFVINPDGKFDADVVLLTEENPDINKYEDRLVIYGPGEFEIHGVSIKGERLGKGITYSLSDDPKKILIGTSDVASEIKDTDGYNAVIIFAKGKIDDSALSGFSSEITVVYGESENISLSPETVKKADKINLKKTEDLKGFVVYLSK